MRKHRIIAGMAAAVLAAGVMALPVSATTPAQTSAAAFSYTPVNGSTATYTKYLVMDKGEACPEVTFNYTVTAGAPAAAASDDYIEVYAGTVPAGGITATAAFTSDKATTVGTASDGITNSTEKQYATANIVFNFSGVSFPEPGVYRYVVTETEPTGAYNNKTALAKTLDVYVADVEDTDTHAHSLDVQHYVLYDKVIDTAFKKENAIDANADTVTGNSRITDDGNKTDGYVNEYTTHTIEFDKNVTGNQASRDKYFKFTVNITNATGAVVTVDTTNFTAAPTANKATKDEYTTEIMSAANTLTDAETNVAGVQLKADNTGAITHDFYLQHGQKVMITGVPDGAAYTITEVAEDYKPSLALQSGEGYDNRTGDPADDSGNEIETGNDKSTYSDTYLKNNAKAVFTNDRDGQIPTGVILSIAAPCVIGIAVVGGLIVLTVKKKKNETEE